MATLYASSRTTSELPSSYGIFSLLPLFYVGESQESSCKLGGSDVVRKLSREPAMFQIGLWGEALIEVLLMRKYGCACLGTEHVQASICRLQARVVTSMPSLVSVFSFSNAPALQTTASKRALSPLLLRNSCQHLLTSASKLTSPSNMCNFLLPDSASSQRRIVG